jgi:hypothetical protein
VWEGGFDERLGEPLAGIGKLGLCGALSIGALPDLDDKSLSNMNKIAEVVL